MEELCLMALKIDTKFEEKLTCTSKNELRNLANFHQSTFESLKLGLLLGPIIKSRKCISLKFRWELCVMTMKNDSKFEKEMTCQFKIDIGIGRILTRVLENFKNVHFNGLVLAKVFNV